MTDYKKKKQLLDENQDLYISDHDKTLGYDALRQIVDAKKSYRDAYNAGDEEAMQSANNLANSVREQYGSYTAGRYGNEYNPVGYADITENKYTSKYDDELNSLYSAIKGDSGSFTYNHEEDPVYKAYKALYLNQGNLAYDRALAENAIKTSGMYNTNANSAAMQAQNYYNSLLASKIPELYEAAYERYIDAYDIVNSREKEDYSRYLDMLDNNFKARDFAYKQTNDSLDRIAQREEAEAKRDFEESQSELDREHELTKAEINNQSALDKQNQKIYYDMYRDSIADSKWRAEYNKDAFKKLYSPYGGTVGSGDLLDYARRLFNDYSLTYDDLKSLFGL